MTFVWLTNDLFRLPGMGSTVTPIWVAIQFLLLVGINTSVIETQFGHGKSVWKHDGIYILIKNRQISYFLYHKIWIRNNLNWHPGWQRWRWRRRCCSVGSQSWHCCCLCCCYCCSVWNRGEVICFSRKIVRLDWTIVLKTLFLFSIAPPFTQASVYTPRW